MLPIEYWLEIQDKSYIYYSIVLLFILLHYLIFRKYIFGVFDFYFLPMVGNIFSCSIVTFMYYTGDIEEIYFYNFFTTQLFFYIGFLISAKNKNKNKNKICCQKKEIKYIENIYFISVLIFIFSTIVSYYMAGIPLFRASRLAAFEGSGGYGIVERASSVSLIFLLLAIAIIFYSRAINPINSISQTKKLTYYITLSFVLIALILSGSKATFLILFQILFLVNIKYYSNYFYRYFNYKLIIKAAVLMLAFSMVVIYHQSDNLNSLKFFEMINKFFDQILFRFTSYGDIYIFSYINENIKNIYGYNALIALFGGFFSTFRLFPVDMMYESVGLQLAKMVSPTMDYVAGPNPRHNVFGYYYFGLYLSPLYSLLLGIFSGLIKNFLYLPFVINNKIGMNMFSIVCLISMVSLDTDFEYALSGVASAIIISPLIIGFSKIYELLKKYR